MFKSRVNLLLLVASLVIAGGAQAADVGPPMETTSKRAAWSVDDLFASPTPFALGHRGYGANLGEDPTRPIENTKKAFRRAFKEGIRIVELDLQQSADGEVVVFHDDYLEDFTCVNALTYKELRKVLRARKTKPSTKVERFSSVLKKIRRFGRAKELSGIVLAEIKVPIPLCDGSNTSAQAQVSESALVAAVVADIRKAKMQDQVIINSGSPTILNHAAIQAPEIKRALSLGILQLLEPEVVEELTGMPVVLIPKNDFGLNWYNVGVIARLPALPSFTDFVGVALATGSRGVSLDKQILFQAGDAAPNLVAGLHGVGIKAIVWTVDDELEWAFVAMARADGITTNDIPLGLEHQASIAPALVAQLSDIDMASEAWEPVLQPQLKLYAPRINPSRDGTVRADFALPDGGPARLSLFDIAGRRIESHDVGAIGAGRHERTLGQNLHPGIYFVRLTHTLGQAHVKAVVAR